MRVLQRKNRTIYNYETHKITYGAVNAIILLALSFLLLLICILISYLYLGDAPSVVAGIGISSIICDIASMLNIIFEIHLYRNFHVEIRTLLFLQIIILAIWIFII